MMMAVKIILAILAIFFGLWSLLDSLCVFFPIAVRSEDSPDPPYWQFPKLVITYLSIIVLMML